MGPWQYDERTGMVAVYEGEKRNCLDLSPGSFIFVRHWALNPISERYDVDREDCATARLIAAAPDLLAALKALVADRDAVANHPNPEIRLSMNGDTLQAIYDAIDKAEGNSIR